MKRLRKSLSKLLALLLFLGFATLLFYFPAQASTGVQNGLSLCSSVVLPALFPFTVAAVFLQHSGLLTPKNTAFHKRKYRFLLSPAEGAIFALSVLGGYPVGARLLENAFKNGSLNKWQALLNLCFCINAGPTFYITVIGLGLFRSAKTGALLLLCNIFSGLVLSLLTRPFVPKTPCTKLEKELTPSPDENFVQSVTEASQIMLGLSAFVTFFTTLNSLLDPLLQNIFGKEVLAALLEITGGGLKLSGITKAPAVFAFFISFGGISVLCQIKFSAKQLAPPFWFLTVGSLLRGGLNALLVFMLSRVFPTALPCFLPAYSYTAVWRFDHRSLLLAIFIAIFLLFTAKPFQKSPIFVKKDERNP